MKGFIFLIFTVIFSSVVLSETNSHSTAQNEAAQARKPDTRSDSQIISDLNKEIGSDPAYQEWLQSKFPPGKQVTGRQFDEAFQDEKLEAILANHPVRENLKDRMKKGLKYDFLLDGVPLTDLADLIRTEFYYDQTKLVPQDTPRAQAARKRWLEEPIVSKMNLILQVGKDYGIVFRTRYGNKEVKGMDALFAAALSQKTMDQFNSRQILFKDAGGKTQALTVTLTQTENLSQVKKILNHFWKDESRASLSLVPPLETGQPPDSYLTWEAKPEKYTLTDNSVRVETFHAREIAKHIAEVPELKVAMLKEYLEWRKSDTGKRQPQVLLEQPAVLEELEAQLILKPQLRPKVEKELMTLTKNMAASLKNHRNPDNVTIKAVPVNYGQPIVPQKNPDIPRIALINPNAVAGYQQAAAQTLGAEVYHVYNASQARDAIKKAYAKYGKKMDVIFASHGNHSFLSGLVSSGDPATIDMIQQTGGMIKRVYLMGCHVGGGTNYNPDHLIKQFVAQGADSAVGVDRTLWSNGTSFFLQEHGGNAVFAVSNYKNLYDELNTAEKTILNRQHASSSTSEKATPAVVTPTFSPTRIPSPSIIKRKTSDPKIEFTEDSTPKLLKRAVFEPKIQVPDVSVPGSLKRTISTAEPQTTRTVVPTLATPSIAEPPIRKPFTIIEAGAD